MKPIFDSFVLGVNYWPARTGPEMWSRWDAASIVRDFANLAAHGFNTVRMFLEWKTFQPIKEEHGVGFMNVGKEPLFIHFQGEYKSERKHPGMIDEAQVAKLDELIAIARKNNLKLLFTLFDNWMSGICYLPDFVRDSEDVFDDPRLLRYQMWYVEYFAERYKNEETVLAWNFGNERVRYCGDGFQPRGRFISGCQGRAKPGKAARPGRGLQQPAKLLGQLRGLYCRFEYLCGRPRLGAGRNGAERFFL